MTLPNPHIAAMDAYALADLTPPPGKRLISLCQNESLRPPSPAAIDAAVRAARDQNLYPDPDWTALTRAIGEVHDLDPAMIVCGNGSLDLIGALARTYLGPDRAALATAHAYPFFRTATLSAGARFDTAPETDLTTNTDALVAALRPDTRVVFVANPANPTGTRISCEELTRLRNALPDEVLLVIDEAYGEFSDHLNERCFGLAGRGDTVILRTFSKAYGLAGARVGWGLFPHAIAAEIRKLLNPNNVGSAAQLAAVAAVQDQAYMQETCRLTAEIRADFEAGLAGLGLTVPRGFTNFSLIRFPSVEAAQEADRFLRAEGVFLRSQAGVGLPDCLRATIGVADDMALVTNRLTDWSQRETKR